LQLLLHGIILVNRNERIQDLKTIAIASQKGGTGKTTTARALGAALAASNHKTLMVDIDPQASLTIACGIDAPDKNMAGVFAGNLAPSDMIKKVSADLFLLPSDIELSKTEIDIVARSYREEILKRALEAARGLDYILIDCPPSLGLLTVNALRASNQILIPAKPEYLGLRALVILIKALRKLENELRHPLNVLGILPTFYNPRILHQKEVIEAWQKANLPVFDVRIPQSIRASEAPIAGQSIIEYAPDNPVAVAYSQLAEVITNDKEN